MLVAAFHDDVDLARARIALAVGAPRPAEVPSTQIGADVMRSLATRDRPMLVGPASPETLAAVDAELPAGIDHPANGEEITAWVMANTRPGDVVVLPFVGTAVRPVARKIYDSGRGVLAVSHNPESRSVLAGSTMSLPTDGTINPS